MNWSLLPGIIIEFVLVAVALGTVAQLAIQGERTRQHRKARAFYAALNRDVRSVSPEVSDRDQHILRSYQTEVWGSLR